MGKALDQSLNAPASAMPTSYADIKRAAEALVPLIEAEADEAERQYHQSDKVVDAFRKAGIYTMLGPRGNGGAELAYVDAMRIAERLCHSDGSTGWCAMVMNVHAASAGAFLPQAGIDIVYPNGADVLVAGQGVPRGYARAVDGGYMVKGLWSYGSGIWHAEWVHSGCFVMDGETMRRDAHGRPVVVVVHHPMADAELKGNWDVLGLRGTGSYDYGIKGGSEIFIPHHLCYWGENPPVERGGVQYAGGFVAMANWGHTSWAMGVGRRVLDELAANARARTDVFGPLHKSTTFRAQFAEAEAKYRAGRALTYEAWEDLCESFAQGKAATVEQFALIRLAMRHMHDVISEIATFAHRASRGASLRPCRLQRAYRDIHSGTQHILMADEIYAECGHALLGTLGPNAKWTLLGLTDD